MLSKQNAKHAKFKGLKMTNKIMPHGVLNVRVVSEIKTQKSGLTKLNNVSPG